MRLIVRGLLFGVLAAMVLSGTAFGQATPLPEAPRKSEAVPGEYLVLFKARESILVLQGPARSGAVAMMLEMQAEHLFVKYGVSVEGTYSAISESNGKGMFFVRSEKAAKEPEYAEKLLESMRSDPQIEAVSPNEIQKAFSTSKAAE